MRIHHHRRRQRVGAPQREVVGVAFAPARIAAPERLPLKLLAEIRAVLGDEVEHAVAAEEIQLLGRVPVHLGVQRVPVEDERRRHEVVVGLRHGAIGVGQVGQRQEREQLARGPVEAVLGDLVVRKRGAAGAGVVAREGIVDGQRRHAEIATPHRFGRHRQRPVQVLAVARPLVAREIEEAVAHHRAAERSAELVVFPIALRRAGRREVAARAQPLVGVVLERRAVQRVGPALDLRVDRRAAGQTLLGVEAVGDDVDRFERFERRNVGGDVRQPDVGRADAVDADVVRAAARAVDVEHQRARGIGRHRVRLRRRREPGQHAEEVLVVAVHRHRQVDEVVGLQLGAHFGAVRLQQGRLAGDRHRFGELANLQLGIGAGRRIQGDRDVGTSQRPEARELDRHRVHAGLHRIEAVRAGGIRRGVARRARLLVVDGDGGARHGRARVVADVADERSIQHLRAGRGRQGQEQQQCDLDEHEGPLAGSRRTKPPKVTNGARHLISSPASAPPYVARAVRQADAHTQRNRWTPSGPQPRPGRQRETKAGGCRERRRTGPVAANGKKAVPHCQETPAPAWMIPHTLSQRWLCPPTSS